MSLEWKVLKMLLLPEPSQFTDKKRIANGGNVYSASSKIKLVILEFLPYLSLVFRIRSLILQCRKWFLNIFKRLCIIPQTVMENLSCCHWTFSFIPSSAQVHTFSLWGADKTRPLWPPLLSSWVCTVLYHLTCPLKNARAHPAHSCSTLLSFFTLFPCVTCVSLRPLSNWHLTPVTGRAQNWLALPCILQPFFHLLNSLALNSKGAPPFSRPTWELQHRLPCTGIQT